MDISVIIPCYNHGEYLKSAIESTRDFTCTYEVIVVDDGSTDTRTLKELEDLKSQGILVVHQENGGPSKARNSGLHKAKGDYILPLDSDNTIDTGVFEKALNILNNNSEISVVYTDAQFIGKKEGIWKVGKLNTRKILLNNQIDTCALIRTKDLLELGGYDESRDIMSNEDWELWLRMLHRGKEFYYLNEVGFQYRVSENSLSARIAQPKYKSLLIYLIQKYPLFYADSYKELLDDNEFKTKVIQTSRAYIKGHRIKAVLKILMGRKIM